MRVHIPTLSVGRNPKYFKQPDEFMPERWLKNGKVYPIQESILQTFWAGPRRCLGKGRFMKSQYWRMQLISFNKICKDAARLEVKVVVGRLIKAGFSFKCTTQSTPRYKTSPVLFHRYGVKAELRREEA